MLSSKEVERLRWSLGGALICNKELVLLFGPLLVLEEGKFILLDEMLSDADEKSLSCIVFKINDDEAQTSGVE